MLARKIRSSDSSPARINTTRGSNPLAVFRIYNRAVDYSTALFLSDYLQPLPAEVEVQTYTLRYRLIVNQCCARDVLNR